MPRPQLFRFHLLRCILFFSTVRDHKQSFSDEIPSLRCFNSSRAHFIEKSAQSDVRYISDDCIPFVRRWYRVKENISTGTGPGKTVTDVVGRGRSTGRAFDNQQEDNENRKKALTQTLQ